MAIFFSIGLGFGGVIAPFIFGSFIEDKSRYSIMGGYLICALFMLIASIVTLIYGVEAHNKSLEELNWKFYLQEKESI